MTTRSDDPSHKLEPRHLLRRTSKMMGHGLFTLIACFGVPTADFAANLRADHYTVIRSSTAVGELLVERTGAEISTTYRVKDVGRGEELSERLKLDAHSIPVEWVISGHNDTGAPVGESFSRRDGMVSWTSDVDRGTAPARADTIYIPKDRTPYSSVILLQSLITAPGHELHVWPSGRVRAVRIRELTVQVGARQARATAWAILGISLAPLFVLEDDGHRVIAALDQNQLIVRLDWSIASAQLQLLADGLSEEYLERVSSRIVHHWNQPIYLRNIRVFDPESRRLSELGSIVVYNGRVVGIRSVTAAGSEGSISIDGEGGTVVPGLCDVHVHLSAWDGPLDLARGVTTVRDMGNDNQRLLALVRKIDAHTVAGPRVILSGLVEGASPYSWHAGFVVHSEDEALAAVHWYADRGYWQIKIYSSLPPGYVAPVAREAHALGLRVAGHVPSFMSSDEAIRDGFDEITHINLLLLGLVTDVPREDTRNLFRFTGFGERGGTIDLQGQPFLSLLRLMKTRGTVLDPDLATFTQMFLSRPGQTTPADAPWLSHMPTPFQREQLSGILDVRPDQDDAYRATARKISEVVKILYDNGIPLFPGTDDTPGFMLDSELEQWQHAGIPAPEILNRATLTCANYLGMGEDLGSMQVGKRADFLLVPGDPMKDITILRQARLVMKDGDVIFPAEVDAEYGIQPFSTNPPVTIPQRQEPMQNPSVR